MERQFTVVVNDEEQYSIWPADGAAPDGWRRVGEPGGEDECLDHVERSWTDMRPLSLRRAMDERATDDRATDDRATDDRATDDRATDGTPDGGERR